MLVDIYKRPEIKGQYSYLALPEGNAIPEEVVAIDWEIVERRLEFDDTADLPDFSIDSPLEQIHEKGYAITSSEKFITER